MFLRRAFFRLCFMGTLSLCVGFAHGAGQNPNGNCHCPDGKYCVNTETGACQTCPEGYYCTNNTQYACSGASVAPNTGMSSCQSCLYNSLSTYVYASENHVVCTACNVGAYIHVDGVCKPCATGKYANEDHTVCVACNTGNNYVDNGVCKTCPSRTFVNEAHTGCINCNSGPFFINGDACERCPDGKYANERHDNCVLCNEAGYYIDNGVCRVCSTNTPYSNEDNTACTSCDSGAYIIDNSKCIRCTNADTPYANAAHTQCVSCAAENVNNGVCTSCSSGTYESNGNCTECEAGYYCRGDGAIRICPKGSFSAAGQSECTYCAEGYTTSDAGTAQDNYQTLADICNQKAKSKLKINSSTGKTLPLCLTESRINKSVIKRIN